MNNLEFINQARNILTQDYNAAHTTEYNAWLAGHRNAWTQSHMVVPFPPFIICAAIAPFKPATTAPSEESIVAKALELYNKFHTVSTLQSTEPINESEIESVDETVSESMSEDKPTPEVISEIETNEPQSEISNRVEVTESEPESTPYMRDIYKIFQTPTDNVQEINPSELAFNATGTELKVIPQPVEELAKLSIDEKSRPTVLQRLQNITGKWSGTN